MSLKYKVIITIFLFILFLIVSHIFNNKNSNKNNNKNSNNKISVVIPCIPRDIKHLDRLMLSIKEQTYPPFEIIIAMSGLSDNRAKLLEKKLIVLLF